MAYTLSRLTAFLGEAMAAIPEQAKKTPCYALGYVVVKYYPGMNRDGTGDSTAGIQVAINEAYENLMVVLFPLGNYTISNTLKRFLD